MSVFTARTVAAALVASALHVTVARADETIAVSAPATPVSAPAAPLSAPAARADRPATGRVTGLPVPRFVSLKARSVNLRVGPGTQYRIAWTYRRPDGRPGLPMEVLAEHGLWRKLRDAEGTTGWVLHSLMAGRRTAVVAPWDVDAVSPARSPMVLARARPGEERVAAKLQAGLVVDLDECQRGWCAVQAGNRQAWLPQRVLWGVRVGEVLR